MVAFGAFKQQPVTQKKTTPADRYQNPLFRTESQSSFNSFVSPRNLMFNKENQEQKKIQSPRSHSSKREIVQSKLEKLTPLTGESNKNFLGLRLSLEEDLTQSSKKHRTGVFGQQSLLQSACTNKTAEADCSTQDIHPRPSMKFDKTEPVTKKLESNSEDKLDDCDVVEDNAHTLREEQEIAQF